MSIEAMKQALEALELVWAEEEEISAKAHQAVFKAITSLRQAIAEAELPTQEELIALYTHPQPKREPLTDKQAQEVLIKAYSRDIDSDMALIRETEAAHGIKENT